MFKITLDICISTSCSCLNVPTFPVVRKVFFIIFLKLNFSRKSSTHVDLMSLQTLLSRKGKVLSGRTSEIERRSFQGVKVLLNVI